MTSYAKGGEGVQQIMTIYDKGGRGGVANYDYVWQRKGVKLLLCIMK